MSAQPTPTETNDPKFQLFLDAFDTLERLHNESSSEDDKALLCVFGIGFFEAIQTSAVYTIKHDGDFLIKYGQKGRWTELRRQFDDNTQAIFNHGDGKSENSIVLLTDATTDKGVCGAVVLMMRVLDDIHCISFTSLRGSNRINGRPLMIFTRGKPGFGICPWPLCPEEHSVVHGKTALSLYVGTLAYLNEQIETDRKTGAYGDGMQSNSIVMPAFFATPKWIRKAVAAAAA